MQAWIKRTLIGLGAAAVLAGGLAACGHRDHHTRMGQVSPETVAEWRGKLLERAGKELVLDATQKQRLGTLFDKLDEQRLALVGSTTDPRAAMQQLVAGERFDRSRALSLMQEKTGAVQLKSPEVINAAADFYDGLNPTQQARVREFMAKRQGRHGRTG